MNIFEIEIPTTGKKHQIELDKGDKSEYKIGDQILVNNGQITEVAKIVNTKSKKTSDKKEEEFLGRIVRKVTDSDKQILVELKDKVRDYILQCQEKIEKHNLNAMKIIDADLSFDGKKITFFFSTEGRIDFRELVSDLVHSFQKIIRLQQIGSRDQTKLFGGFGKCGQELCCFRLNNSNESITLEMAKKQEINASSSKISGLCGKLMCCLAYELEDYEKLAKDLPQVGEIVKTKEGEGRIIGRNILQQTYTIVTKDGKNIKVEK